ncbi:hypothetical protein D3C71_1466550 [compost metagenome]
MREEVGLVVAAVPQREKRCAAQADGVLDVITGRLQSKRVAVAGTFEHEEDADRISTYFDAGVLRIGCRCFRHLPTSSFSAPFCHRVAIGRS